MRYDVLVVDDDTMLLESGSRSLALSRMDEPPPGRQLEGATVGLLLELAKAGDEAARDSKQAPPSRGWRYATPCLSSLHCQTASSPRFLAQFTG